MERKAVFADYSTLCREIGEHMIKMKKRAFITLLISVILVSFLAGAAGIFLWADLKDLKLMKAENFDTMQAITERYGKLYTLQNTINEKFLWDTDEEAQMDAMYSALVESLGDEYSSYMNEADYQAWNEYVEGIFYGVGLSFSENEDGEFEINSVVKDGPADLEGVKAGDVLLKVDGKSYETSDDYAEALRGDQGTQVKVTLDRNGREKNFIIVRGEVEESSVYATMLDDGYGYIQITGFEKSTAEQFKTELANLENKNAKGMIIDLRNNLGGIMDQSIEIADMLLPECTIIHTEDRQGEKEYYNSDGSCTRIPYVLLVNEKSASAAEILAAAVKENDGGKLVGTETYGKGIIQSSIDFKDGTGLRLTTMQYLSPKGNKIHKTGVKPDYQVELSAKSQTDKQFEKALEVLKKEVKQSSQK